MPVSCEIGDDAAAGMHGSGSRREHGKHTLRHQAGPSPPACALTSDPIIPMDFA